MLFNIFGGITRCDEVASGLIEAFDQIKPTVPFVVRLDGTNDKEGRELLAEANLPNVHTEATMHERRREGRGAGEGCMSDPRRQRHEALRLRHHRPRGHVPRAEQQALRHATSSSGVTPGKGGQDVEGIPVFNTFHDAVAETGANTAMIFVPPRFAADSILEAEDAGIELDHRDHRGHPRPRRAARLQPPRSATPDVAPDRPELPGHPLAGQGQRRASSPRRSSRRATSASSRARAR